MCWCINAIREDEMYSVDVMDTRIKHPFTALVAGPTGCGKTQFVTKLLKHHDSVVDKPFQKIVWCYGEYQVGYAAMARDMPFVQLHEGIPSNMESLFDRGSTNLIILDDLMSQATKDERVAHLFTKGSHHRNLSVIVILQNLFHQGKESRTISLNAHYMVLFKNPRDSSQITHLAKQIYPQNGKFLQEAYKDATSKPYGYLFIDLKPDTDEQLRLRSKIFPGEENLVYVMK